MTKCKRCLKYESIIDSEYCKFCMEHFTLDFKLANKEINKVKLKEKLNTLLSEVKKIREQLKRLER
jgi:hypothetical protein